MNCMVYGEIIFVSSGKAECLRSFTTTCVIPWPTFLYFLYLIS